MSALGSFGRSRARRADAGQQKITFADVAGIDEAKAELSEIVDFLKHPDKYQKLGGRIPKGVLLSGRPGTGKTLLARAVAGEADAPFFSISASEFIEAIVGIGASRVRDLFKQAKEAAPAIIFIDELDAVGRSRSGGAGFGSGSNDEREQTLNQILTEMDGFDSDATVIVLAATNRSEVLDSALLRPGRFDRRVTVPAPDLDGRAEIFKVHTRSLPLDADVDLNRLAATAELRTRIVRVVSDDALPRVPARRWIVHPRTSRRPSILRTRAACSCSARPGRSAARRCARWSRVATRSCASCGRARASPGRSTAGCRWRGRPARGRGTPTPTSRSGPYGWRRARRGRCRRRRSQQGS